MFAIWTSLGLQFEFGKAEFKDRDEMWEVKKKWLRVRPALSQGGTAEMGAWGWSPRQFHPIATARLDKGEAEKESQGRKPRTDKLYAPGSFNSDSESRLELTGHLHLGRRLCRLHPQPPCTASVHILPAPRRCSTSDASHRSLQRRKPSSVPLSRPRSHPTLLHRQEPGLSCRPPASASWRGTVTGWPWLPRPEGTVMWGSDRQTHLGWSGRDHWERGHHSKRASFSVPVELSHMCYLLLFICPSFLVQVILNGGWPGTVVDIAMAIF